MPDFSFQGIKDAIGSLLGQSTGEDAVTMLIDDHRRVKEIFDTFKDLDDHEKIEAKHKALVELALHAAVEEKLVYPLLRDEGEEDEVNEAVVEHHLVKLLIVELEAMKDADALLDAKFKVLGEIVDHHVKEEESDMFPKLRASDNNLQELGAEIKSKKEELLAQLGDADDLGIIDPELAPHSTRNGHEIEEDHSDGDGIKRVSDRSTRAPRTRATSSKSITAKKSGSNSTNGRTAASSTKKAAATSSAPKTKKVTAKKVAQSSSTSTGKKVAKKRATPKPTTRAKASKAKPASASGKRASSKRTASSSSKTTLKSVAKARKPATASRTAATTKKTAKKKTK